MTDAIIHKEVKGAKDYFYHCLDEKRPHAQDLYDSLSLKQFANVLAMMEAYAKYRLGEGK